MRPMLLQSQQVFWAILLHVCQEGDTNLECNSGQLLRNRKGSSQQLGVLKATCAKGPRLGVKSSRYHGI